jgi:deoxyribodipyrimidine photo-lyase
VPELQNVPDKYIHKPWEMPVDTQLLCGCRIGADYPEPLVDHIFARQRALETYKTAKVQNR